MEAALRALQQENIGIRDLKDKKLTKGIHMCYISGYKVWTTEADSKHQGGITIVWI